MYVTRHADRELVETAADTHADGGTTRYSGAERRSRSNWLTTAFNEVDFGILLLSASTEVVHGNRSALSELAGHHPLRIADQCLCARDPRDAPRLLGALQDAGQRGLRRLLVLGTGTLQTTVAVVPLAHPNLLASATVMLMLSRRDCAAPLAVEAFARSQGLTSAETRVLLAVCHGKAPQEIAHEAGVEISTVRSQIAGIRDKTGARNLRTLVLQVAALPPFMGVLGHTFGMPRLDERQATKLHPAPQAA